MSGFSGDIIARLIEALESPTSSICRSREGAEIRRWEGVDVTPPVIIRIDEDILSGFIESMEASERNVWPGSSDEEVAFNILSMHLDEEMESHSVRVPSEAYPREIYLTLKGFIRAVDIQAKVRNPAATIPAVVISLLFLLISVSGMALGELKDAFSLVFYWSIAAVAVWVICRSLFLSVTVNKSGTARVTSLWSSKTYHNVVGVICEPGPVTILNAPGVYLSLVLEGGQYVRLTQFGMYRFIERHIGYVQKRVEVLSKAL